MMAKKVFLGVGHGGSDPGAVSGTFKESEINLTMALAAKAELERHGVSVGISRIKEEEDRLAEEIKECKAFDPDVAIECHNNAAGTSTGNGFEVYVQTGTYKAQSRKMAQAIAKRVSSEIGQELRGNDGGLRTKLNSSGTDYFGWLRQLNCPAVLLEGFFVDGVKDRLDFDTKAEQQAMGKAYAHGVLDYLGIKVKASSGSTGAAASTPASGTMYTVQVGAFKEKKNADGVVAQLKGKGFAAMVKKVDGLYCVQAGAFKSKANAQRLVEQLKAKGYAAIIKTK